MTAVRPFDLGVNYWPSRSAMGFWRSWSGAELSRDFARMKDTGLDTVRIFLTWEDFQPSPDVVDTKMLVLLKTTLDLAARAKLRVIPTLFTGHMSGVNWFPGWAVDRAPAEQRFRVVCGGSVVQAQPRDWYTDSEVRLAQVRLAAGCSATLAGHPALLAWDLGNENSNCVVPPDRQAARSWLHSIADAIREEDPKASITLGLHMEDLEENRGLTPSDAAEVCDFLTMHGYPGYADFTRGSTDERLLPFLAQLTRFLGRGKDVLFGEFGVPTYSDRPSQPPRREVYGGPELVSEWEAARFVERGLRALIQSGATGAMLWCFSDYSEGLLSGPPFDGAPHEGSFGLVRHDGSPKPAVDVVRKFAASRPMMAAAPRVPDDRFIDLSHDDFYDDPGRHLSRLFDRYCAALGESDPFSSPLGAAESVR